MSKNNFIKLKSKHHRIAIVSGVGELPRLIISELLHNKIEPIGFCPKNLKANLPENIEVVLFDLLDFGYLIHELKKRNVKYLVFAGKITRDNIDERLLKDKNANFFIKEKINLQNTDDKLLRVIGDLFENNGFNILSIPELVPNLLLKNGIFTNRKPSTQDKKDIIKAKEIHRIMSIADIGQSLVVSKGQCIALETLPGTDKMIEFVKSFKQDNKQMISGIFFKSLKFKQDKRFDFPVIGEKTLLNIKKAKLNGIAFIENELILLNHKKLIKIADDLNLFIHVTR